MRFLLNKSRFLDIVGSGEFQRRFRGKHIVNPDNIKDFSDLQGEIEKFKVLSNHYKKMSVKASGRNKYVYQNTAKVTEDSIEQLQFIVDRFLQQRD